MKLVLSARPRWRRLGAVVLLATVGLVSACSSSTPESDTGAATAASLQLGWIANVENMGPYVAEHHGYYTEAGVDLTITPGGPSVVVEPLVASGKATVGLSSIDAVARARNEGAPLKVVGATLQTNPTAIMSLDSSPIKTLQELVGKKVGVQTSGVEVLRSTLERNDISPDDVEFVTVEFDPAPLVNGEVDAFMSFLTNQPIQLAQEGVETHTFPLADYGYTAWGNVFVVNEETLADPAQREAVIKILGATAQGWETAFTDTDAAAEIVVNGPGKDLNLDLEAQKIGAKAFEPLIVTDATSQDGLLTMSADGIAATIQTLADLGVEANPEELFDTSLLAEAGEGRHVNSSYPQ